MKESKESKMLRKCRIRGKDYDQIRKQLENVNTRQDIKDVEPFLRDLFPDYTETPRPDAENDYAYGIWRMANKKDEIGRIPTVELSYRMMTACGKMSPERFNRITAGKWPARKASKRRN